MKASLWLRIGSLLSLLFALGHMLGARQSWSPIGDSDVLRSMASFRFDVSGVHRTYLDFYLGFGFMLGVFLLLQAVMLWQLAKASSHDAPAVRPLVGSIFLGNLACAGLAWKFIFPMPALFSIIISASLGIAYQRSGKHQGKT